MTNVSITLINTLINSQYLAVFQSIQYSLLLLCTQLKVGYKTVGLRIINANNTKKGL